MTNRNVNLKNQSFAAATKTITGLTYIYVNPSTGNDVTGSGLSSVSPFQTIQRAFDYLEDKTITNEGFVIIKLAAGIHVVTETIVVNHPDGSRISICGAEPSVRNLKQVTSYSSGLLGVTAFGDFSRTITVVVVGGSSGMGFTETHGIPQSAGDYGILVKNTSMNMDGTNSIRNKFADESPNAVVQAGILGCHRIDIGGITGTSITLLSYVKNNPTIIAANQYVWGSKTTEYQLGGNSDAAQPQTAIAAHNSPVGYYGSLDTVGRTAESAIGITAPSNSYLYNVSVPSGEQVTPDTIEVVFVPTVIQSDGGIFHFINSGLRSICGVVMDGIAQNGRTAIDSTPRVAMRFTNSSLGAEIVSDDIISIASRNGTENVGILNFTHGILGETTSVLDVGDPTISNCFCGISATDSSTIRGERLTILGSDYAAILATNNSSITAPLSFVGVGGMSQTLVLFSPQGITADSFHVGDQVIQTTAEGLQILGQVNYWDASAGILLTNHVEGRGENRPTFQETVSITGASGGTYDPLSTFAQGSILAVTPIEIGYGALATNNSFVSMNDSISVFNRNAGFAANNASSLQAQRSVSIGNSIGFNLANGAMGDITSSFAALDGIGIKATDSAQMTANMVVTMNNFKHNFEALNGSNISAVGYEARMGPLGQCDFHFFASNGSKIVNSQPTYVESLVFIGAFRTNATLTAPTENFVDNYTVLEV